MNCGGSIMASAIAGSAITGGQGIAPPIMGEPVIAALLIIGTAPSSTAIVLAADLPFTGGFGIRYSLVLLNSQS